MKTSTRRSAKRGFVSYVVVLTTGLMLTLMAAYAYRRAITGQTVQNKVQLRSDYAEKEDAILRAVVAITPNRAIRAMQGGSNSSTTVSDPLRWQNIFTEALDLANARTSIDNNLKTQLGITNHKTGNTGDSALGTPSSIFKALNGETGYVSAGINRSLGTGFPPPLSTANSTTTSRDPVYPIISGDKIYNSLAQSGVGLNVSTYSKLNLLTYPNINFGYAKPGDPIVAKRNWWAFSLDVAGNDAATTKLARPARDYVLSIYEIPSQLAISASSFMSLGQYSSGEFWQNVSIAGGVFAGKAQVESNTALNSLASRRGMTMSGTSTVGGQSFANNPFTPGVRENYQVTTGEFFPVSLASESGRVAFIPINRGAEFFDRLATATESSTVSPTTWNNYSVGASQCAMRLDITQCVSATDKTPTALRFSYLKSGARQNLTIPLGTSPYTGLPPGYLFACNENQTYNFGTAIVDVAYGKSGSYAYQSAVTGSVTFNNARFGDPLVGTVKAGYYKPSYPFEIKNLSSGRVCVAVYPQRFAKFLAALNADDTSVNNSIAINVDYTTATGSIFLSKPSIPCTDLDYGVILQECADLSSFTKGFSIVTNLRTYIGDDFNTVPGTPPSGYTPTSTYYPPCSLFAPEKRYGVDSDPFAVSLAGQIGSLASDTVANPIRPLDSKTVGGTTMTAEKIKVNLRPITHPADLPPVTMMNWLVMIEERRKEFINY
jgi:hypothetical protein